MAECCIETKEIFQGDTLRQVFLFQDGDGNPLDLSPVGSRVDYTLVENRGGVPLLAINTTDDPPLIEITDGANGEVTLDIPGATTSGWPAGGLLYQLEYYLPGPPVSEGTPVSGAVVTVKEKL